VQIGSYPDVSLKEAREVREEKAGLVRGGKSPAEEKRKKRAGLGESTTVQGFGEKFFTDVIEKNWADPSDLRRYLDKDVYPKLGNRPVKDITPFDIQEVVFAKRDSGAPTAARHLRSLLVQLFDYAVAKQIVKFNPVLSLKAKQVAKLTSRDRALSPEEIRRFLQALYGSNNTNRCLKIALHLVLLTLVRKRELLRARWEHVDFETGEWLIPKQHSKNKREHIVYLSSQALGLFRELQILAGGSALVLPGRLSLNRPYAHSTLNEVIDRLALEPRFTVHDLRRTASTLLHERDFPSDVIEMALNHKKAGVRGVYNKAQYAPQRRKMLQFWADFVEGLAAEKKVLVGHFMRA